MSQNSSEHTSRKNISRAEGGQENREPIDRRDTRNSGRPPATQAARGKVDQLIDYVNNQIELLAFDDPEPFLLRQMVESLADPRRATRLNLVESFSQIGEPATPFLLEGITHHSESVVRRACCNALTNIGDPESVPGLIKALTQDPDIGVKSAAAGALAKIGAPAFDSLRAVLASNAASESCKGHAAWAIASMSSEVSDRLYRIVSDPSSSVRTAAVGAIAHLAQKHTAQQPPKENPKAPVPLEIGQPHQGDLQPTRRKTDRPRTERVNRAMTVLTEALNDHSSEVRVEAAAHLARLNCQKAYQPLIACLQDSVAAVRQAAALALAKLGNPDAIEKIAHLQQDAEESVQRVAVLAIEQLRAIAPENKSAK